jgi:hypothetical protein
MAVLNVSLECQTSRSGLISRLTTQLIDIVVDSGLDFYEDLSCDVEHGIDIGLCGQLRNQVLALSPCHTFMAQILRRRFCAADFPGSRSSWTFCEIS